MKTRQISEISPLKYVLSGAVMTVAFASFSAHAEKSVDEIAKDLANPNTPLASLKFKTQYRSFEGDLQGADDQDSTSFLFQPSLPFPLDNGDSVLFRPAIPIEVNKPLPSSNGFEDADVGLGDISFDLAYAITNKETGLLTAYGFISTLPTATVDELGSDRITLGPEILIGKLSKTSIFGMFPNHQWDIGGSGDADISLTSMQMFGVILPGGGWNYGTSPTFTYDHEINEATVPLNFSFGKTVISGGRPWKLGMEFNYYVAQPDQFGPEFMIGIDIAPVVENGLAGWFD